jgi:uncharacterized protein YcbX|uniref:MOSC domain-containing protein n=1 Tax=Eutreptiella gymnastica TaxID=73025 RepID=A0A7S4CWY2_9EUGL
MEVTAVYVYPVKSCKGVKVDTAQVTELGFKYDREWMVVDKKNVCVTLRTVPTLGFIQPEISSDGTLGLNAPDMPSITVPTQTGGKTLNVKIFGLTIPAADQGDEVAQWLSQFLKEDGMRLVHYVPTCGRIADDGNDRWVSRLKSSKEWQVKFPDEYPWLIATDASLKALNASLTKEELPEGKTITMSRFRPNIVVGNTKAWEEDQWGELHVGSVNFHCVKACGRCAIPTIDPETAEFQGTTNNPIPFLTKKRDFGRGPLFGQAAVSFYTSGTVSVGDKVNVVSRRSEYEQAEDRRAPPPAWLPIRQTMWLGVGVVAAFAVALHIRQKKN